MDQMSHLEPKMLSFANILDTNTSKNAFYTQNRLVLSMAPQCQLEKSSVFLARLLFHCSLLLT